MFEMNLKEYMELKLDYQEKDLLIDCIQHRLDTDKILVINDSLKNEIEDLLVKIEEECVWFDILNKPETIAWIDLWW